MKGLAAVPPIVFGHRCNRCGNPITDRQYMLNGWPPPPAPAQEHLCDDCYIQARTREEVPSLGGPRGLRVVCPHCGQNNLIVGDFTTCANPACRYRIHPIRCPGCHVHHIDRNAQECDRCHWQNPSFQDTRVRTTKTMQKRISNRVYETMIFEIIGAFLILGLPFIGFPAMPFLAVAFMAFLPLYNFLPSESELIASRQQNVESLGGEATTLLILKGMSKLFMFFFSVAQFVILPVSKLIPLAISFFYYFTLPVSYKTTQPFKMMEAWLRPFAVGPLIAVFIYWGFLGSSQAISLALMSVAFFCTSFPRHRHAEPGEQGQIRIEFLNGGSRGARFMRGEEGAYQDQMLNILFIFLMIFALNYSNVGGIVSAQAFALLFAVAAATMVLLIANVSVNHVIFLQIIGTFVALIYVGGVFKADMLSIIFLAVWELSVISGLAGGKESRPAMGILMILMTLFVFSFTATGVMGNAVFGFWWPQIEGAVSSAIEPLGPLWEQATGGISDAWLILTNPWEYYKRQTTLGEVKKSIVKTGGTTKSIELGLFDLWPTTPGTLDPREPLLGYVEFENKGEFNADYLKVDIHATYKNVTDATMPETPTGVIERVTCSGQSNPSPFDGCEWTKTIYPSEIKTASFKFSSGGWGLLNAENPDVPDTYQNAGFSVKIYADYTYTYSVNVSIPVEVIRSDVYEKKLMARDISLYSLESQYSGGPVKATLFTLKQPVRSDEYSLVKAAILNEGRGNITAETLSFDIYVPDILKPGDVDSSTFSGCSAGTSFNQISDEGPWKGFWKISCNYPYVLGPNNYSIVIFPIKPDIEVDTKTTLIVGVASYEYKKYGSSTLTLATVSQFPALP